MYVECDPGKGRTGVVFDFVGICFCGPYHQCSPLSFLHDRRGEYRESRDGCAVGKGEEEECSALKPWFHIGQEDCEIAFRLGECGHGDLVCGERRFAEQVDGKDNMIFQPKPIQLRLRANDDVES
jgi:hypothetical protein